MMNMLDKSAKTNPLGHKPTWFESNSGKRIYPTSPVAENICIEDIAHALSHCCRFAGHCREFYSVAAHSVLVYHLVNEHTNCKHTLAAALTHDAAEAYTHDITRPLKQQMPWYKYKKLEARWEVAIMEKLGIDACVVDWDLIKDADNEALRLEAKHLMLSGGKDWGISVQREYTPHDYFFDEEMSASPSDHKANFLYAWFKDIELTEGLS